MTRLFSCAGDGLTMLASEGTMKVQVLCVSISITLMTLAIVLDASFDEYRWFRVCVTP